MKAKKAKIALLVVGVTALIAWLFFQNLSLQKVLVESADGTAAAAQPRGVKLSDLQSAQPEPFEAAERKPKSENLKKLEQSLRVATVEAFLQHTFFPFRLHIPVGATRAAEPSDGVLVLDADFNSKGQALYFVVAEAESAAAFIRKMSELHSVDYQAFRQLPLSATDLFQNPSLSLLEEEQRNVLLFWGLHKGKYKLVAQIQRDSFDQKQIAIFKTAVGQK